MSRIRADKITNKGANGAPDFPNGITVAGVITATTLDQTLNGDLTVTGKVSIGGTLTYEDVTNIDSIGIITARDGIKVGPSAGVGGTFYADGSYRTAGILTATNVSAASSVTATTYYGSGANLTGIDATQIQTGNTSVQTVDTGSDGHIKFNTEGSEKVRIVTNGKIGIGEASPDSSIHIKAASGGAQVMMQRSDAASNDNDYGRIYWKSSTGAQVGQLSVARQSAENDGYLKYVAMSGGSTTERFRISKDGAIGLSGANYGSSGQVLKSGGSGAAPTWGAADGWAEHVYFNKDGDLANCSTNTWAKVAFDAGYHRGTSTGQFSDANDRYTPGVAGWYLIHAAVVCHSNGSNTWWHIEVRKNNSGYGVGHSIYPYQTNGTKFRLACTGLMDLDADDYIEVFINQSTGGTRGVDDKTITVVRVGTNS